MESSVAVARAGVGPEDLPELVELIEDPGPFVSVVVPTERATADAQQRFAARWRGLSERLTDAGAPAGTVEQVGDALAAARIDGDTLAIAASVSGSVLMAHDDVLPERAGWDALPHLVPFLQWEQATPAGVLAVVDRTGADLFATGERLPIEVVEGETGPLVHRGAPGGWSQRRFQQRAERTWRANAGLVAEELQQVAEQIDARVIVLAGDDRALTELVDQLPERLRPLVRRASGSRGEGSEGHLAQDVRRWYRTVVAEDSVSIIRSFEEELGRRDRAVAGLAPTIDALRMAAVDTLLVHEDSLRGRRVHRAVDEATQIALHGAELEGLDPTDVAAADALIAAAWASGAQVRVVPSLPALTDGVGAVLRFPLGSDAATGDTFSTPRGVG